MSPPHIAKFRDAKPTVDIVHEYQQDVKTNHTPLVIDNGSYHCRVGWATDNQPRMIFRNHLARQRGKKDADVLVGNEISSVDTNRWLIKTPFDKNVVTQFDVQEQMLDHTFHHLSIDTDSAVQHPIVMTEPLCNPNSARQNMSQLMFECYHVPSLLYGVDALLSYQHNKQNSTSSDGLIVSFGHHTTHVIPVLHGDLDPRGLYRLNLGGYEIDYFMQKLLHLKYPAHIPSLTFSRAEECVREYCHTAVDFFTELSHYEDLPYYEKYVHKIQLPFTPIPALGITAATQKEKKDQQLKRQRAMRAKKREEKLSSLQSKLERLMTGDRSTLGTKTKEELGNSSDSLTKLIVKLSSRIHVLKGRISDADSVQKNDIMETDSDTNYLNSPHDELSAEKRKIRCKQILEKCVIDGRHLADKQLQELKVKEESEEKEMEINRQEDYKQWLNDLRRKRKSVLESKSEKRRKKEKLLTGECDKKENTFCNKDQSFSDVFHLDSRDLESDSDVEDDKLDRLDTLLREHDTDFEKEYEFDPGSELAEFYRLHLAVEKIRCPELVFQPSMVGHDQLGLVEMIENSLSKYTDNEQSRLVQYILLTGSPALLPNMKERLETELMAVRPFQSEFKVVIADDPCLDAWHGARTLANAPSFPGLCVTRAQYEEMGSDYIREHAASNRWFTPVSSGGASGQLPVLSGK